MSEDNATSEAEQVTSSVSAWDTLVPPAAEEDTAAAYVDSAVEAVEAEFEDVPEWLGTRWRDLPQESMSEVWQWLRGWVDWVVEAHSIPASEIPPCWFRHQNIIEELWAAANAEQQAWEATGATMTPMTTWHFHLRMMRDRLQGKAQECVAGQKHVPPHSFRAGWGAGVLAVDETDWAQHLLEITDTQSAALEADGPTLLWRMCAATEGGEVISSDAVDVAAVAPVGEVIVSAPVRRGMDPDGDMLLGATVVPGSAVVERTWWESSADGGLSWDKAVASEVDRTPEDESDDEDGDSA